eukprot:96882-Amphidinium_carterae.1
MNECPLCRPGLREPVSKTVGRIPCHGSGHECCQCSLFIVTFPKEGQQHTRGSVSALVSRCCGP